MAAQGAPEGVRATAGSDADGSRARATVRLTGAEALVRVLSASGITDYFGIVGGNLKPIFRALDGRSGSGDGAGTDGGPTAARPRYTGVRHEASAGFMAAGVYASTGRLAVALAELGPGTVNLVAGLGMAYNNHLPVLAVTSALPDGRVSPLIGTMMELDGLAATRAVTQWNARVTQGERIPSLVRWAIREATTGTPGPVHLDIPSDVLEGEWEYAEDELDMDIARFIPAGRSPADPEQIARAASLIEGGSRVLLIAGGGVVQSEATEEFRALADRLGAAATGTQMAIGVVSTESPRFIGHAGAIGGLPVVRAFREADVVIAVGCKFGSWLKDGTESLVPGWPSQSLIQVDIDPSAIGRAQPAALGLVGDARAVLRQLLEAVSSSARSDPGWLASLAEDQRARRRELAELAAQERLHPAAIATAIGEALPDGSLVVYDGGHTSFWSNDLTPATEPRTRFNDSGMAQLGFGLPFALGLQRIHPDRTVVQITGDGSFGFTLAELDTARRYGLPVITVIHDNESWGVIERGQRGVGFELGARLAGTDYAAIARGFGCFGEIVTEASEILPAFERARQSGLPAVLDIRTCFDPHPNMAYFGATLR